MTKTIDGEIRVFDLVNGVRLLAVLGVALGLGLSACRPGEVPPERAADRKPAGALSAQFEAAPAPEE